MSRNTGSHRNPDDTIECAFCGGSGYTWEERDWRDHRSEHQVCDVCNSRGWVHARDFDINDLTKTREMPPVTDAEAVADLSSRGGVW